MKVDLYKCTQLNSIFFLFILAMISYLVISAVKQIPMMPVENSLILAGVQSFLLQGCQALWMTNMIELLPESSCSPLASWKFVSLLISQHSLSWTEWKYTPFQLIETHLKKNIHNYYFFFHFSHDFLSCDICCEANSHDASGKQLDSGRSPIFLVIQMVRQPCVF